MDETIGEPTRVLLVDDDPMVLRVYARVLAHAGLNVVTASGGQEALAQLSAKTFDVVLSDIAMPNMTGIDFLRTVRQGDLDVPVILMTAIPNVDTAVPAVEHGAFRYLLKPIEPDDLLQTVRRAANLHRLVRLRREARQLSGSTGYQLGDRASLEAHFEKALARLVLVYQPIVRWFDRTIFAWEVRVRSDEPTLPAAEDLYDAADRLGRIHDLGRCVRSKLAAAIPSFPQRLPLFLGIHAEELNDNEIQSDAGPLSPFAERLVLQLTERARLDQVSGLRTRLGRLRRRGFKLALNNLGGGYAGLAYLAQVEPDYVKLDETLVRGIAASTRRRSVTRSMVQLCTRDLGIQVIAEGAETADECEVLATEGLDLMQSDLFGAAGAAKPPVWPTA